MDAKVLKVVKTVLTVAGLGISLAASILSEKELDNKLNEKVADALAKQEN